MHKSAGLWANLLKQTRRIDPMVRKTLGTSNYKDFSDAVRKVRQNKIALKAVTNPAVVNSFYTPASGTGVPATEDLVRNLLESRKAAIKAGLNLMPTAAIHGTALGVGANKGGEALGTWLGSSKPREFGVFDAPTSYAELNKNPSKALSGGWDAESEDGSNWGKIGGGVVGGGALAALAYLVNKNRKERTQKEEE